jgi:hypothetical protein
VSDVPLPGLLDAKQLQAELGISRAAAEKIMRRLPVVQVEGLRKTYVRRADVADLIASSTTNKKQTPTRGNT